MTADAARIAAVAEAVHDIVCGGRADPWSGFDCERMVDGGWNKAGRNHIEAFTHDATVAVETLTPLIRAQVAAEIRAEARQVLTDDGAGRIEQVALLLAARIAEGTS